MIIVDKGCASLHKRVHNPVFIFCIVLMLSASLLSACSPFGMSILREAKSFDQVTMKGVVLAFNADPPGVGSEGEIDKHKKGYMILVNEDGSSQIVETAGMAQQMPVWTRKGLYFSDRDTDYFLNDDNGNTIRKSTPNPKVPYESLAAETPSGDAIELFDLGFEPVAQESQPAVNKLSVRYPFADSKNHILKAFGFGAVAYCGDVPYGINDLTTLDGDKDGIRLVNIESGDTAVAVVETEVSSVGFNTQVPGRFNDISAIKTNSQSSAVCSPDGVFTALLHTAVSDVGKSKLAIVKWNIHTGKVEITPITLNGKESEFAPIYSYLNVGGNTFITVDNYGNVYSCDIETGKAVLEIPKDADVEGQSNHFWTHVAVSENHLVRVTMSTDEGHIVKISIFDKNTKKLTKELTLSRELSTLLQGRDIYFNNGMAINPRW